MAKTRLRNITRVDDTNISVKSKKIGKGKKSTIIRKHDEVKDAKSTDAKLRRSVRKLSQNKPSRKMESKTALQAQREVIKCHDENRKIMPRKCVVRLRRVHIINRDEGVNATNNNQTSEKSNNPSVDVPSFSVSSKKSNIVEKSPKHAKQLPNIFEKLSANEHSSQFGVEAALRDQHVAIKRHSAITKAKHQKCVVRLQRLSAISRNNIIRDGDATNNNQSSHSDINERVVGVPRFADSRKQPAITEKLWNMEINDKLNLCLELPKQRKLKTSLPRTPLLKTGSNKTDLDVTSFEPIRNSSLYNLPERVGKQTESESLAILNEDNGNFSQNLANKSELVNKLLLSDDQLSKNPEKIVEQSKPQKKTQKIFFRKEKNFTEENNVIRKTRNVLNRNSIKSRNVYDFLSSSQNPDFEKHEDPAADIIKKMIKEGRVVVTTLRKGQGKPKIKQQRKVKKVRPVGKRRQCSLDDIVKQVESATNNNSQKVTEKEPPLSPVYEPEHEMAYDDQDVEEIAISSRPQNDIFQVSRMFNESKNPSNSTDGSISRLARSVLINQTKSANKTDLAKRRQLLDVARKFVSTPVNKKVTTTTTTSDALRTTNLSPIVAPSRRQTSGGQSPWRVSNEAAMPNTFFFGRNTSNLPSFSSDFIQGTPEQQTKSVLGDQTVAQYLKSIEINLQSPRPLNSSNETNNSNAENVAPVPNTANNVRFENVTLLKQNENNNPSVNQENENFVHLPNPRRALEYRSPLKPINILEVITLPSWKNNVTPIKEKLTATQSYSSRATTNKNFNTPPKEKYFGFEDFFNNSVQNEFDEDIDNVPCTSLNATKTTANKTLHEKLQNLREIRPADDELPRPAGVSLRRLYDDSNTPRQRNIKDMFCSTMINNRTLQTEADNTRDLFNDPDPETTFDRQKPHQTYVRASKRKRKQRHQFVMFMDSDLSEEEDGSDYNYKAQKQKKKCTHREGAQMNEFVTSFNAMCKEVEQFEIPVE